MIGTTLGNRYKIIKLLGAGGMAKVYLGQDQMLDRPVAVKVLHSHMRANEEIVQRFHLEAQAVSKLDHPNIVKIYDYSGKGHEQTWLITEFINGKNLSEFLESNQILKLSPSVAVALIIELGKAIQAAHDQGIIHRDVKPENVMITEDGKLKLMDFGIAKRAQRADLTQVGTFMGSPSYMSPEQIRGKHIDQRSDQFSLCIVFYELLTGRLPFNGNSAHEVANKILAGKFKPPSVHTANVPAEIEKVITKGLEGFPDRRFSNTATFLREIQAVAQTLGFEDSKLALEKYVFKSKKRALNRLQRMEEHKRIASATQKANSLATTAAVSGDPILIQDYYSEEQADHENWNPEYQLSKEKKVNLNVALPQKKRAQHRLNRHHPHNKPLKQRSPRTESSARTGQNLWAIVIGLSIVLITLLAQQIYQRLEVKRPNRSTPSTALPVNTRPELKVAPITKKENPKTEKKKKKPTVRLFDLVKRKSPEVRKNPKPAPLVRPNLAATKSLPAPKFTVEKVQSSYLIIQSRTTGVRISLMNVNNMTDRSSWVNSRTLQKVPLKPGTYQLKVEKGSKSMKKNIEIRKGQPFLRLIVDF